MAFFTGEQASWITGTNLAINGGHHMGVRIVPGRSRRNRATSAEHNSLLSRAAFPAPCRQRRKRTRRLREWPRPGHRRRPDSADHRPAADCPIPCHRAADTARSAASRRLKRRSSDQRLRGKLKSARSFLRIRLNIASCSVRDRSRTRIWVESVRPPAEPTLTIGSLRRRHQAMVSSLTRNASQASSTTS